MKMQRSEHDDFLRAAMVGRELRQRGCKEVAVSDIEACSYAASMAVACEDIDGADYRAAVVAAERITEQSDVWGL